MKGDRKVSTIAALRPLVADTAAARISDRFVTAISLGQFVVGQKLPTVQELAKLLEVSPTTVREALSRLAALGYVAVKRGRHGGTFVILEWDWESDSMVRRTLESEWDQLEVTLDFRSLTEQQIARTAAKRHTPEDVLRIERAKRAYELAEGDRERSRIADLEVHQAIAAATHNTKLAELSLRIRREVSLGFEAEPYSQMVRTQAIEQHALLAQAIIDGDPEEASRLAAEHFALTEITLRKLHARISSNTSNTRGDK